MRKWLVLLATYVHNKLPRLALEYLHFPKFQANTPAPASSNTSAPASSYLILMTSSSSFLKRKKNYDVFLSFRDIDVHNNFLGHLCMVLNQKGILAYVDSEELKKGEQITPVLMNAIEELHVAIIIFCEDYASSLWCLEDSTL